MSGFSLVRYSFIILSFYFKTSEPLKMRISSRGSCLLLLQIALAVICLSVGSCSGGNVIVDKQKAIWSKLSQYVQTTLMPEIEYIKLMKRYHSWFHSYKAIQDSSMKDGMSVIKEEFTKVDQMSRQEAACEVNEVLKKAEGPENLDHVYEVMKLVIDRLEKSLEEFHSDDSKLTLHNVEDETVDEEQVGEAMKRIREATINGAKDFIKAEGFRLGRMAAFNALAAVASQQHKISPENQVWAIAAPLLTLLGGDGLPTVSSYLRSVETRSALGLINRVAFGTQNFACGLSSKLIQSGIELPSFLKAKT